VDPSLRNEILLIDSAREVIGLGLNSLFYSLNETDTGRLREAKQKLDKLTPQRQGDCRGRDQDASCK